MTHVRPSLWRRGRRVLLAGCAGLFIVSGCRKAEPCTFPGASLLVRPNLDDDDADGRIDGLQVPPPVNDDDLTVVDVELSERCEGTVWSDAPSGEVRLWLRADAGWAPLARLPRGRQQLGVEVVRGRNPTWSGNATLRLSSADAGLALETPPFLVRTAETLVREVWAAEVLSRDHRPNDAFIEQLEAALPSSVTLRRVRGDLPGADRWVQDAFQATTVGGVAAMLRMPRAGPTRGLSDLSFADGFPHDTGMVGTGVLGDSRFDYGGNLEVLSPHQSAAGAFPRGRLIAGEDVSAELEQWLVSQGVQTPLVKLPTGWLESGHVDDVLMPLPSKDGRVRVLFASTRLALAAVRGAQAEPSAAFNRQCQARLDAAEAVVRAAIAPAPLEAVHLPVLFNERVTDAGVLARPAFPNPVNSVVLGTTVLAGASDGGASESALQATTTAQLEDAGLSVRWLDVSAYAVGGGSVHCALEVRPR